MQLCKSPLMTNHAKRTRSALRMGVFPVYGQISLGSLEIICFWDIAKFGWWSRWETPISSTISEWSQYLNGNVQTRLMASKVCENRSFRGFHEATITVFRAPLHSSSAFTQWLSACTECPCVLENTEATRGRPRHWCYLFCATWATSFWVEQP